MHARPHENRILAVAIVLSVAVHVALLAYRNIPVPAAATRSGHSGMVIELVHAAQPAAETRQAHVTHNDDTLSRPVTHKGLQRPAEHTPQTPAPPAPEMTTDPVPDRVIAANPPAAGVAAVTSSETLNHRLHRQVRHAMQPYFDYPLLARRRGWQGTVRIGLRVNADGQISRLHIVESSRYPVLDRAALNSLGHVTRVPEAVAWLGGRYSDIVLPVEYRLTDS